MVGIDKLQITSKEFKIKSVSHDLFSFDRRTKQGESDLPLIHIDSQGFEVKANKIVRISDHAEVAVNLYGLQVQFNPSKHYHKYHLTGLGNQFKESVGKVKQELWEAGIDCSLEDMQISRIDLTDQHEMAHQPTTYNEVFRLFKGSRCKERTEYPEGFRINNSLWSTIGYDKLLEVYQNNKEFKKNKAQFAAYIGNDKNLLRIENSWKKSQAVNSSLPFRNIRQLFDSCNEELTAIYKSHLVNKSFNKNLISEQIKIDFNQQGEIFRQLLSSHKTANQAAISHLFILCQADIDFVLREFGGMEEYRIFLQKEGGISRNHAYTITRLLQKILRDTNSFSKGKALTVTNLFNEVIEKFAA